MISSYLHRFLVFILPARQRILYYRLLPHYQTFRDAIKQTYRIWAYETYDDSAVHIGKYRFHLHRDELLSRHVFIQRNFAEEVLALLKTLTASGGSFIDAGANIGLISIPTVKESSLPALAIEPVSANFELLKQNLTLNGLEHRVITAKVAVGDEAGSALIFKSNTNAGDHRLSVEKDDEREAETVDVTTLDSLISTHNLQPPYVVKIDVQGYEPKVLAGAVSMLNNPCMIVTEVWPTGLKIAETSLSEFDKQCSDAALAIYEIVEETPFRLRRVANLESLCATLPDEWAAHTNIFLTNMDLGTIGLSAWVVE